MSDRAVPPADLFPGFDRFEVEVAPGVALRGRAGGAGAPLLLLHGHPQTHAMWHRVAPALATRRRVVLADLRGYGDSARPEGGYDKRTMAADLLRAMAELGHARFDVCAHDRGARVAHRLAVDHPQAVSRLMLLDIAPTLAMYEQAGDAFARAYWHWFFLIQPPPLPERLIEADPAAYVREVMGRRHAGLSAFAPAALAEYERCMARPASARAVCEDYRASAGIDLVHDRADRAAGRRLAQPLRLLWGTQGTVGRLFDVPRLWAACADTATGRALDCGHYLAEEAPAALLAEMDHFFP